MRRDLRQSCVNVERSQRGIGELDCKLFEGLAQMSAAAALRSLFSDQRVEGCAGQMQRIEHAGARIRRRGAGIDPFSDGVGQCDQMRREIATVHRGDVARIQRPQILGVVPVIEMPAEALESLQRRERRLEPLDSLDRASPAEIASADCRQQVDADIGG